VLAGKRRAEGTGKNGSSSAALWRVVVGEEWGMGKRRVMFTKEKLF
jgi:hypothetical protein